MSITVSSTSEPSPSASISLRTTSDSRRNESLSAITLSSRSATSTLTIVESASVAYSPSTTAPRTASSYLMQGSGSGSSSSSLSIAAQESTESRNARCALAPTALGLLQPVAMTAGASVVVDGVVPLVPTVGGRTATPPGIDDDSDVAESVGRLTLLANRALVVNVSLMLSSSADNWALVGVHLDVIPADSMFPVLTAGVGVALVSSTVVGRQQLPVCLLHPPNTTDGNPRWLPSTFSKSFAQRHFD